MTLRVWLDRGRQCGHFAPRTLSKSLFMFFRLFTYVVFHICSGFFDLTGTFQVQPLSGKGWWYVYNFDWYPKCPKWSALSRNVSICVVPVPVFRPLHPCLSLSLFFLKNLAGRLASQPCIWLPPYIFGCIWCIYIYIYMYIYIYIGHEPVCW